ncbi:MAG: hypothetical protein ACK56F_22345 [bacterium]
MFSAAYSASRRAPCGVNRPFPCPSSVYARWRKSSKPSRSPRKEMMSVGPPRAESRCAICRRS